MPNSKVCGTVVNIGFPSFMERHVGPDARELRAMLQHIGYDTLESLIHTLVDTAKSCLLNQAL